MIISGRGTLRYRSLGFGQKGVTMNALPPLHTHTHTHTHTTELRCGIGHFANTIQIVAPAQEPE